MKVWIVWVISIISISQVVAQSSDSLMVTKNFKFNNGVYLTFESFQNNRPDYSWIGMEASSVINASNYSVKIDWLRHKNEPQTEIEVDSIWGICLNGIPYIQVENEKHHFGYFTAIRVRGSICYYSYDTKKTEYVEIKAYNPLTRRPFRTASLPREKQVEQEMILDFKTGKTVEFNQNNFLKWIKDDEDLWSTVKGLTSEEVKTKLFKCILIYDDRNPIYLKL